MAAIAQEKEVPNLEHGSSFTIPIFRFYFDGLIAHFHRPTPDGGIADGLGPLIVGNEQEVVLNTITYARSWQFENLEAVRSEAEMLHPRALARILGSEAATGPDE